MPQILTSRKHYYLWTAVVYILGILSSVTISAILKPSHYIILITLIILVLLLSLSRRIFIILIFILVFLLGGFRYTTYNRLPEHHIKNYTHIGSKDVLIRGEIIGDIESTKRGNKFIIDSQSALIEGEVYAVSGKCLVMYFDKNFPYFYGDVIEIKGKLASPPDYRTGIGYRKYLAYKKIYSVLYVRDADCIRKVGESRTLFKRFLKRLFSTRYRIRGYIQRYLSFDTHGKEFFNTYSSLALAILIGDRSGLSSSLKSIFANTGTMHILAISGLHIGLIYFIIRIILKIFRVNRNISIVMVCLFLFCYSILTGARAPIVRASLMFGIFGLGQVAGRKISPFNLIGLSGLIILIISPNQLFDIGFILSYIAVFSILLLYPMIYRAGMRYRRWNIFLIFKKSIAVSLSAWIGLLPVIAYNFGLITPIAVIANLVAVPLLFLIIFCSFIFIVCGMFSEVLAGVFSQSLWFLLHILIYSMQYLEQVPFSHFKVSEFSFFWVIFYYICLGALSYRRRRRSAMVV